MAIAVFSSVLMKLFRIYKPVFHTIVYGMLPNLTRMESRSLASKLAALDVSRDLCTGTSQTPLPDLASTLNAAKYKKALVIV